MAINYTGFAFPKIKTASKQLFKSAAEAWFRKQVWGLALDKDRFTGQTLSRVHADPNFRGQVCHLQARGSHPDRRRDPYNAILLSDANHQLSDARGGNKLHILHDNDSRFPITFILYDRAWWRADAKELMRAVR